MESARFDVTIWGIVTLLFGGMLVFLYIQARKGDPMAIAILSGLAVLFVVVVGAAIVVISQNALTNFQSRHFKDNAKENLDIMLAQARAQNELNRGTMQYAQGMQKLLPQGQPMQQVSPWDLVDVDAGVLDYEDAEL